MVFTQDKQDEVSPYFSLSTVCLRISATYGWNRLGAKCRSSPNLKSLAPGFFFHCSSYDKWNRWRQIITAGHKPLLLTSPPWSIFKWFHSVNENCYCQIRVPDGSKFNWFDSQHTFRGHVFCTKKWLFKISDAWMSEFWTLKLQMPIYTRLNRLFIEYGCMNARCWGQSERSFTRIGNSILFGIFLQNKSWI